MALIYFSHLTTPPLPASRPRWVDASRSIEFTFFPCYAPSRRAKRRILKNGRELKVFIFSRLGRETLMLPLRVSRVIRAFPHSSCVVCVGSPKLVGGATSLFATPVQISAEECVWIVYRKDIGEGRGERERAESERNTYFPPTV